MIQYVALTEIDEIEQRKFYAPLRRNRHNLSYLHMTNIFCEIFEMILNLSIKLIQKF
jgi:hypothetical protein